MGLKFKKKCNLKEITHVKPQLQKNKFLIKPMFDASLLDNAPNKVLSRVHYPKGKPTVLMMRQRDNMRNDLYSV